MPPNAHKNQASIDLSPDDIRAAHRRIRTHVHRTPLERSARLSELAGCDVYLKLECWQRTRSFKIRGATNAVACLEPSALERGLVTASTGNHARALARAAREAGANASVYVPESTPAAKTAHIEALGARLHEVPGTYDDAEDAARRAAERGAATFVHACDDPAVIAGQGTVGLEIMEALPGVRELVVPVGGGGLIGGIGTAVGGRNDDSVRLLGVQTPNTSAMKDAFDAGGPVEPPTGQTLADGLGGAAPRRNYELARRVVDSISLVPEDALPRAIHSLYTHDGVVAEGAAAVGVAAILEGALRLEGPTVLVITGGNIDGVRLANILGSEWLTS